MNESPEFLYRVTSARFCAGIAFRGDGSVVACAPILRGPFVGMGWTRIVAACGAEGWTPERVA